MKYTAAQKRILKITSPTFNISRRWDPSCTWGPRFMHSVKSSRLYRGPTGSQTISYLEEEYCQLTLPSKWDLEHSPARSNRAGRYG